MFNINYQPTGFRFVRACAVLAVSAFAVSVAAGGAYAAGPTTPASVITGHVVWQGITPGSANNNGLTAILNVCNAGTPISFPVVTDQNGNFTLSTTLLGNGQYNWQLKGSRNLATAGTVVGGTYLEILSGAGSLNAGIQKAGDANNSNVINSADFNILKSQFGQGGTGLAADFDNNGAVNTADYSLLKSNYSQAGQSLTCP